MHKLCDKHVSASRGFLRSLTHTETRTHAAPLSCLCECGQNCLTIIEICSGSQSKVFRVPPPSHLFNAHTHTKSAAMTGYASLSGKQSTVIIVPANCARKSGRLVLRVPFHRMRLALTTLSALIVVWSRLSSARLFYADRSHAQHAHKSSNTRARFSWWWCALSIRSKCAYECVHVCVCVCVRQFMRAE